MNDFDSDGGQKPKSGDPGKIQTINQNEENQDKRMKWNI